MADVHRNLPSVPTPRVENPSLQRFLNAIASRVNARGMDSLITNQDLVNLRLAAPSNDPRGPGGPVVRPVPLDPTLPTLALPPLPTGFEAWGGIGVVVLIWDNPYAIYANHARARLYRHTADELNNAVPIGESVSMSYTDRQVDDDTTYYYWVRFETTAGVLGPPTESATATTGTDPEKAIRTLAEVLEEAPYLQDLYEPIPANVWEAADLLDEQQQILAELRRVEARIQSQAFEAAFAVQALAGEVSQSIHTKTLNTESDLRALEARVTTAEGNIIAQATALTALTTRVTDAEGEITAQATALTRLTSRVTTAEGDITGNATAITSLTTRVTTAEGNITSNASDITSLDTRVTTAEGNITTQATAITNLTTRVSTAEGRITSHATAITSLTSRVQTAEGNIAGHATAITGLTTRVTTAEGRITANASNITSLTSRVTSAERDITSQATAITSLTTRVTSAEGSISSNATSITTLDTRLTGLGTGTASDGTSDGQPGIGGISSGRASLGVANYRASSVGLELNQWSISTTNGATNSGVATTANDAALASGKRIYVSVLSQALADMVNRSRVGNILTVMMTYSGRNYWVDYRITAKRSGTATYQTAWQYIWWYDIEHLENHSQSSWQLDRSGVTAYLDIVAIPANLPVQFPAWATAMVSLEARVSTNEGSITSQASEITSLKSRVTTAEGNISSQASALSSLTTRVTTAEGNITSQATALTNLTTRVTTAEGRITSQATALTNLTTRVTTAEGRITANANSITSLSTRVTTAEGNITTQATALSSLTTRVTSAEGSITSNASSITSLDTRLTGLGTGTASDGTSDGRPGIGGISSGRVSLGAGNYRTNSTGLNGSLWSISDVDGNTSSGVPTTANAANLASGKRVLISVGSQAVANMVNRASVGDILTLMMTYNGNDYWVDYRITAMRTGTATYQTAWQYVWWWTVTHLENHSQSSWQLDRSGVTAYLDIVSIPTNQAVAFPSWATALVSLEARVSTNEGALARWTVKLQVGDLVGGIGLYNDGTNTRFVVQANQFAVLPSAGSSSNIRIPFEVSGGVVYINNAVIRSGSITGAKIAGAAITNSLIANAAVSGTKIANSTITGGNIANSTITSADIANSTITGAKIAGSTIQSTHILNGTIVDADIANGTITGTKIRTATITNTDIANGTITGTKIANVTITSANILTSTITGGNIASGTIQNTDIADSTITGAKLAGGTITGAKIATGTIQSSDIADSTITSADIANSTITGSKIRGSTITSFYLADGTITGAKISNSTITGSKISNSAGVLKVVDTTDTDTPVDRCGQNSQRIILTPRRYAITDVVTTLSSVIFNLETVYRCT